MDVTIIVSIASLTIAIFSIPVNYWLAKRQIQFEFKEKERQIALKSKALVINDIDEFFRVFFAAVEEIVHIKRNDLQLRLNEINPFIREIDDFVEKTQILKRLDESISELMRTQFTDITNNKEIISKLMSIRNQIHLGSDANRSVSLAIIKICNGDSLQNDLRKHIDVVD